MIALLSRIPAIVWVFLVMVILGLLLWKQHEQNVELRAEIKSAQEQRSHAEAEKARLIESDRKHAAELAAARNRNAEISSLIRANPEDGCLSRALPSDLLDALRVPAKGGKARTPSASRPKADAVVQGNDLPGRPDPHPGASGVGNGVRSGQSSHPPDVR